MCYLLIRLPAFCFTAFSLAASTSMYSAAQAQLSRINFLRGERTDKVQKQDQLREDFTSNETSPRFYSQPHSDMAFTLFYTQRFQ